MWRKRIINEINAHSMSIRETNRIQNKLTNSDRKKGLRTAYNTASYEQYLRLSGK